MNEINKMSDDLQYEAEQRTFITKVFGWMFFGLVITAIVAFAVANNPVMLNFIYGNQAVFIILLILEFVLVAYLAGWVKNMRASTATGVFLLYAAINGLTLSFVFIIYELSSIYITFLIAAGMFGTMSLYGYVTRRDLTSWGNLLFMMLIGLIIASVVNLFLNNETAYWVITYIGIITFVGLTAYDTQKIKELNVIGNEGTEEDTKEAISGALQLYLDFINLFLYLLRIFGRRK